MPSIKLKKKTQEYLAEKEREKEKEAAEAQQAEQKKSVEKPVSKKKTPALLSNLDGEVLTEKRKRSIPVVEQRCADWVVDNFEHKEDLVVGLTTMYQYYTETALEDQGVVVDVPVFNRIVKEKLGDHFGVKESSPLKGVVKEKKPGEKKPKEAKQKSEPLGVKIKDVVTEVITAAGNPLRGLHFQALKKKVGEASPPLAALFETHPGRLLQTLDKGVRFGQITLVRGTGKCGAYRIPGESTAEEDKPKPKKEKTKKSEKSENGEDNSESAEGETGEGEKEGEEAQDLPVKKRGKKRKSGTGEESVDKAGEPEGGEPEKEGEEAASPKKKRKRRKATKKPKRELDRYPSVAERHAEPRKIEDIFPMAITFMGDPKEASLSKIKHYIETFYPEVDCEAKLRKALEKGEDGGLWQRIGNTFRILQTDFNPSYSNDINDMITQAIMATHSPKIASARLVKKYITEYHPDFDIENKPHLYKMAIERGIKKGIIRQATGIGSSGSFQLVYNFNPSPAILAGEAEDERAYLQEEKNLPQDDEVDKYTEVYVVRKTKSGRFGGPKPWGSAVVSSSSSRRRR